MTEFGPTAERELERWRMIDAEPDWKDVMARARVRLERPRRLRRLYVAFAALAATALAAPAFALIGEHFFGGRSVPGTLNVVSVNLGSGRVASLYLHSHGSAIVRDAGGFHYRDPGEQHARVFSWRLGLWGIRRIDAVRIAVSDGPTFTLCTSCGMGSGGTFVLRSDAALALLDGRAIVALGSRHSRVIPAMGGRLFLNSAAADQSGKEVERRGT